MGELWWWVTVVVLVRELGITVMRLMVLRYVVLPASPGGKLKTVLQSVAIGLYLLPFEHLPAWINVTATGVMVLAVAATVITGADYVSKVVGIRRTARA
jgi:phosphatidylglycerophosphate synthase